MNKLDKYYANPSLKIWERFSGLFVIALSALIFSCSSGSDPDPYSEGAGTFKDSRDDKVYKWRKISDKIWMSENLKYRYIETFNSSLCYDGKGENCGVYGRLYNFSQAGRVCPKNWRLPNKTEWENLFNYISGSEKDLQEFFPLLGGRQHRNASLDDMSSEYEYLDAIAYYWIAGESEDGETSVAIIEHNSTEPKISKQDTWNFASVRCVR